MKSIIIERSGGSGSKYVMQPTLLSGIKIVTRKNINKFLINIGQAPLNVRGKICFWASNNDVSTLNLSQNIYSQRNALHVETVLANFQQSSIATGFYCAATSGTLGIQQYIVSSKNVFYRVVRDIKTGAWGTDQSLQHKGDLIGICTSSQSFEHLVTSRPNDPAYPYFATVKWDTCSSARMQFKLGNGYDPAPPSQI